jgi:hypothetical protein
MSSELCNLEWDSYFEEICTGCASAGFVVRLAAVHRSGSAVALIVEIRPPAPHAAWDLKQSTNYGRLRLANSSVVAFVKKGTFAIDCRGLSVDVRVRAVGSCLSPTFEFLSCRIIRQQFGKRPNSFVRHADFPSTWMSGC